MVSCRLLRHQTFGVSTSTPLSAMFLSASAVYSAFFTVSLLLLTTVVALLPGSFTSPLQPLLVKFQRCRWLLQCRRNGETFQPSHDCDGSFLYMFCSRDCTIAALPFNPNQASVDSLLLSLHRFGLLSQAWTITTIRRICSTR